MNDGTGRGNRVSGADYSDPSMNTIARWRSSGWVVLGLGKLEKSYERWSLGEDGVCGNMIDDERSSMMSDLGV
ncbi:hypothetical protein Tco_0502023 [Tanacetum coccineum]